ncbi:MAG: CrcB family protein [Paracoccus sp. (in: a-proteobacteria)]|uniref:fluoride efflux transporter FluC n=1 Tax=Paracoccus sp. TaxID=267 RepID=UPI0026E06306|nr:CrcB family protein [Paracoccus sp. (in: a-proteobacteria)]MDO5620721.1 CrcB family protein [Paracoccus sp. (in: a-proteobacteria)]
MEYQFLQVAFGGAMGASMRYGVGLLLRGGPLATLTVNVAGCFVMGLLVVALGPRGPYTPLLLTGLLGGFTTFSAFSLDALTLWEAGQTGTAAIYVMVSVMASLAAVFAGAALARWIGA